MTDAVKAELGHTSDDDGQFYMSFSDYYSQCSETYFNIDSSDWYSDAFLKLGDVSDGSGSYSWCGDECTRRMVDLYSEVDQLVYVTAHTWDARSMTDSCEDWTSANMPHSLYVPGDQYVRTFKYGAAQAPSFQMSAGQTISLTTEWNFTNSERNNDWSVVAFGESGTVTLTSSLGASDSLPVITKQDGSGDNNDEEEEDVPEEEEEEDVPIEEDDEEDVVPADPEDGDEDIIIPDEEEEDDWEDDWDWESYDAFFEFVDNHEVSGLPEGYCGSSLYESGAYTSDGEFFWQTAIKSTCDWINSEYTVYMDHDDWWALTTYWYEFDADWNWAYDSIIKECHTHATETDWTGCTFILGQVVPEDYFVTEPLQLTAGWMNAPGQYGIRSYSSKWVWP